MIGELTNLISLSLPGDFDDKVENMELAVTPLTKLIHLQRLDLSWCKKFNINTLRILSSLKKITQLELDGCECIYNDSLFELLLAFPRLQKVYLTDFDIEQDGEKYKTFAQLRPTVELEGIRLIKPSNLS